MKTQFCPFDLRCRGRSLNREAAGNLETIRENATALSLFAISAAEAHNSPLQTRVHATRKLQTDATGPQTRTDRASPLMPDHLKS